MHEVLCYTTVMGFPSFGRGDLIADRLISASHYAYSVDSSDDHYLSKGCHLHWIAEQARIVKLWFSSARYLNAIASHRTFRTVGGTVFYNYF
ncbi:hypothetical protein DTO166G4_9193 [Paecilomyces variotii]|nr:hypothetical protein DTO032I3_8232 [Paecilomyces variotii]KAJ9209195.1 hypothetical protein DTO166G4_9193 [Paecilomyces variotii]KAJ9219772.1 hypothetical protein DTO169C6_7939 [Paecilomyces variotii]KAJ9228239.1 hypothetical protein DTO166G5_8742 [Paecilomyces variotii]KAJ9250611.1 hypothetical protein DTO207G8_5988 [Paecilomyces variotii]